MLNEINKRDEQTTTATLLHIPVAGLADPLVVRITVGNGGVVSVMEVPTEVLQALLIDFQDIKASDIVLLRHCIAICFCNATVMLLLK